MKGIYLLDNKQNLIKSISADLLTENTQEQELGGQITGRAKFPYKDFDEEAEYFGVKEDNNFWLYKIRKKQKESGYITIDGIHIFFDELKGTVVRDIRNQNTSGNLAIEKIISGTGWELKSNITERIASKNYYYQSALSAFYDAVKTWNFEFIPEILFKDGKIISKKISIYDEISKDFGKWYEYGDKLISVVAESSTDELYTAFIGRGKGIATKDENGEKTGGYSRKIKFDEIEYTNEKDGVEVVKPKGIDFIEIKEATKLYGYPDGTPRIGVVDFDDIEDPKLLADATFEYALKNTRPKLQLRAKAIETETIELGETVAIIRPDMNIRYKVRVFKIQKDFLKAKVISFEFGDKIVRSAGERLKSELYEKRRREEEIDSYIDSLRDEINSSYFNDAAYNYDLKIGNKYNLPAGYYSFDRPIDKDPTKVIYMGAGKMLVADKKNPDGSWKWGTMATGDGVVAESIVGTLGEFAKVNAYQINVNDEFADTALGKKVVIQDHLYNNVKITGTKGIQVLDNQNRERVQLGNWASGRYGLNLKDASGNQTILDDQGILQSWQDGRCDNADQGHPLKIPIYLPKETARVYKAYLRLYITSFRAFSKSLTTQETKSSTTSGGGFESAYGTTTSGGGRATTSHGSSNVDSANVWHTVYKSSYDHTMIGEVEINKVRYHEHEVDFPDHSHSVQVSVSGHSHDYTIPGHSHEIVYGIYEEYNSDPNMKIYINGTDRTYSLTGKSSFGNSQNELNITNYLNKGMWNVVEIRTGKRMRIDASIFIQALLNYGGY